MKYYLVTGGLSFLVEAYNIIESSLTIKKYQLDTKETKFKLCL